MTKQEILDLIENECDLNREPFEYQNLAFYWAGSNSDCDFWLAHEDGRLFKLVVDYGGEWDEQADCVNYDCAPKRTVRECKTLRDVSYLGNRSW